MSWSFCAKSGRLVAVGASVCSAEHGRRRRSNGQDSPTIETTEADVSDLGIQMRGYHGFGVVPEHPEWKPFRSRGGEERSP